jgi:hypothetical protein
MTVVIPDGVVADGQVKVLWVPTIADTTQPTVDELTGVGVIDLSCFLSSDGLATSADEQTITDERLCSTQTFTKPGRFTRGLQVKYVYDQQAAPNTDTNEAYETMKHLTDGYVVQRWGLDYETAVTAGDIVDVWPVTCGVQLKLPPEANTTLKVQQTLHPRNAVQEDVEVVSGS